MSPAPEPRPRTDAHFPVLIVGGGPVGMLLAAELGSWGVRAGVVEAHTRTPDVPRAGTLHARSVQSLLRRGYLRQPVPGRENRAGFHFGGMPLLSLSSPAGEGPPLVGVPQAQLERLFEARARAFGADVRRGHRLSALRYAEDGAEATVVNDQEPGAGPYRITARWVIGADGARSTVRSEAGITSTTTPATFSALVGQVRLDDPGAVPPGWTRTRGGSLLANVTPQGPSRLVTHTFPDTLPDRRTPPSAQELRGAVEQILGRPVPVSEPTHLARFSDFTRLADAYRAGPVLLAGDAAHVHAPLGGQGLNTGLQDAFNLGWRLGLVARGYADEALLDGYHAERHPIAAQVIANTRLQAAVMRPGPENDPVRDFVTSALQQSALHEQFAGLVSGQGISYPAPPGSGAWAGRFLPNHTLRTAEGTRTVAQLLAEGVPLLLVRESAHPNWRATGRSWAPPLKVVTIEGESETPGWEALLCRPDGYAAWSATPGADPGGASYRRLREVLTGWFGRACASTRARPAVTA
ncbi:FAD-dependent monooxygenase [Streptomyces sp. ODS28]|uniref:FAD-dependent monooxygenase n=1 Tax=Streptomyces sp. ODS28 TaxID=3136688 RepID=UPI0031E58650